MIRRCGDGMALGACVVREYRYANEWVDPPNATRIQRALLQKWGMKAGRRV